MHRSTSTYIKYIKIRQRELMVKKEKNTWNYLFKPAHSEGWEVLLVSIYSYKLWSIDIRALYQHSWRKLNKHSGERDKQWQKFWNHLGIKQKNARSWHGDISFYKFFYLDAKALKISSRSINVSLESSLLDWVGPNCTLEPKSL